MNSEDWRQQSEEELIRAQAARHAGNEGRARVCARRAAGLAARDFLSRRGIPAHSAYQALQTLTAFPGLPADLLSAAADLTLRVDADFRLPPNVDPLAAARLLCDRLPGS
ncbi:MAG: hypothetical protein JXB85_14470 [Anaerolineales bacterium]|nr:hypothetical protein [Anaerolineales bacterium]